MASFVKEAEGGSLRVFAFLETYKLCLNDNKAAFQKGCDLVHLSIFLGWGGGKGGIEMVQFF